MRLNPQKMKGIAPRNSRGFDDHGAGRAEEQGKSCMPASGEAVTLARLGFSSRSAAVQVELLDNARDKTIRLYRAQKNIRVTHSRAKADAEDGAEKMIVWPPNDATNDVMRERASPVSVMMHPIAPPAPPPSPPSPSVSPSSTPRPPPSSPTTLRVLRLSARQQMAEAAAAGAEAPPPSLPPSPPSQPQPGHATDRCQAIWARDTRLEGKRSSGLTVQVPKCVHSSGCSQASASDLHDSSRSPDSVVVSASKQPDTSAPEPGPTVLFSSVAATSSSTRRFWSHGGLATRGAYALPVCAWCNNPLMQPSCMTCLGQESPPPLVKHAALMEAYRTEAKTKLSRTQDLSPMRRLSLSNSMGALDSRSPPKADAAATRGLKGPQAYPIGPATTADPAAGAKSPRVIHLALSRTAAPLKNKVGSMRPAAASLPPAPKADGKFGVQGGRHGPNAPSPRRKASNVG